MQIRALIVLGGLVLILAIVNWQIVAKERVLRNGELLLLELAPVDPRSLIQGDYMALDYAIAREMAVLTELPGDGRIVVANDTDGVAHFVRLDVPGSPLGAAEHLLRYRWRGGRIRIGPNAFFFQEGQADRYRDAHYGELRVDDGGECLLVGLRDRARQRLPPRLGATALSPALSPGAPGLSASPR